MTQPRRPRHVTHRDYDRERHGDAMSAYLTDASDALDATGAATTFTVAAQQGVAATGTLTLTGNMQDGEVVVIGDSTYTFQDTLTDDPFNVLVGADADESIDNLVAAITGGDGEGTLYGTATGVNQDVTAENGTGDTMDITALKTGVAGNSIATTTDAANASWEAVNLESGARGGLFTATAHGFASGDGPFQVSNAGGALPTGLDAAQLYWVERVDANTFALHIGRESAATALVNSNVEVSTAGTGTQSIARSTTNEAIYETTKLNHPETVRAADDIDDL